jgi:hypothetical protein
MRERAGAAGDRRCRVVAGGALEREHRLLGQGVVSAACGKRA